MASKKNNSHPLQFKNIYFETSEMLSYPSKNQKSTPKLSRKIISIHIHFPCPIAKLTYNIYTLFNASINICTLMYVAIDNMFMYISSVRVGRWRWEQCQSQWWWWWRPLRRHHRGLKIHANPFSEIFYWFLI